ncbi:DUF3570 domain-containing protein [Thiotrichales bacterium 19X7-9]|nr:DUF3570 domain-containing protein [Thiotrichales bacterium 19X7-9]
MSKKLDKKKQLLCSLTGAALLLPGIALTATQDDNSDDMTSSVADLKAQPETASNTAGVDDTLYTPLSIDDRSRKPVKRVFADIMYGGSNTHFDYVDNNSDSESIFAHLQVPISDSQDADIIFLRDVTTSATPIFYTPTAGGGASQVTTSASVIDRRTALNVKTTHYSDYFSVSVNGGFSDEDDYTSLFTGLKANIDMNDNNTTLTFGGGYSYDDSYPVSSQGFTRTGGTSHNQEYLLGITQVITPRFLMSQNVYYANERGFLSDPYKLVWITPPPPPGFSPVVADSRPEVRNMFAFVTQALYYFNGPAMNFRYRYYIDNWGIHSHTFNLSLNTPIGNSGWTVIPGVRYYSQSAADFYSLYFTEIPSDGYWTSDYRLAGFGEIGLQLEISKEFIGTGFRAYAGYEYSYRNKSLQLFHTAETQPGESEFTKLTMNVFYVGIQKLF